MIVSHFGEIDFSGQKGWELSHDGDGFGWKYRHSRLWAMARRIAFCPSVGQRADTSIGVMRCFGDLEKITHSCCVN